MSARRQEDQAVIDIDPTSSGLPGIAQLRDIVGAVMTVGLFLSVLALVIAAIVWGFGANSSNPDSVGDLGVAGVRCPGCARILAWRSRTGRGSSGRRSVVGKGVPSRSVGDR
ncbi:DUF6112 family protein [Streptomyces sp. NPDC054771]